MIYKDYAERALINPNNIGKSLKELSLCFANR